MRGDKIASNENIAICLQCGRTHEAIHSRTSVEICIQTAISIEASNVIAVRPVESREKAACTQHFESILRLSQPRTETLKSLLLS